MFDSKIANVVAYGGIALLIAAAMLGQMVPPTSPSHQPSSPTPIVERTAPRPPTEEERSLLPKPGNRITMTEEQIRWPQQSAQPASDTTDEPAPAPEAVVLPRPASERPPERTGVATPMQPAPVEAVAPIVLGAPPRPLGTLPANGTTRIAPASTGGAVESLRGWNGGSLIDHLSTQQAPASGPFVPPANIGQ